MTQQTKKQHKQQQRHQHYHPQAPDVVQIDPAEAARRAAAARAYALNSHTADVHLSKRSKSKNGGSSSAHHKSTTNSNAVRKIVPLVQHSNSGVQQHNHGNSINNVHRTTNYQHQQQYHQVQQQQHQQLSLHQQHHQQQVQLQQQIRLNDLSNKIDDGEYIKFVQGLWTNNNIATTSATASATSANTTANANATGNTNVNTSANTTANLNNATSRFEMGNNYGPTVERNKEDNFSVHNNNNTQQDETKTKDENKNEKTSLSSSITSSLTNNEMNVGPGADHDNDGLSSMQIDDDDDEEYDYQLEDDDEDDDDDDDENDINNDGENVNDQSNDQQTTTNVKDTIKTTISQMTSTTSSSIIDSIDDLDDFDFDHEALEQELGSLLEEDMEAAVNSLLFNHELTSTTPGTVPGSMLENSNDSSNGGGSMLPPLGSLPGTPQKKNSDTPLSLMTTPLSQNHSRNISSKSPLVTGATTTPSTPLKNSTPITPTKGSSSTTSTATTSTPSSSAYPIPTEEQILKLQKLMSDHYQTLLQQSVLAVRAAHGNKFNKDGLHEGHTAQYNGYRLCGNMNNSGDNAGNGIGDQSALQTGVYKPFVGKRKRHHDFFFCGETADDLGMILDGAVTMLQDLDENRRDAIRYSIQMSRTRKKKRRLEQNGDGNLDSTIVTSGSLSADGDGIANDDDDFEEEKGRLTRSAFSRTLQQNKWGGEGILDFEEANKTNLSAGGYSNLILGFGANTTFGVKGLSRLDQTFAAIDNSLNAAVGGSGFGGIDIFDEADHGHACEVLLRHARADFDRNLIPGYLDLSQLLTYPGEVVGSPVEAVNKAKDPVVMSPEQQTVLRKNRGQFTASEDNLLLRGVNLYGEKEWTLISDRYLPDRSISSISQRYWRLCLLIYKGQGIAINKEGGLLAPPKHLRGIDDFDEKLIARTLNPVQKPIEYGLYRWSMEEDIMLLKAVPLMGRMFAEIVKRFIPHRDRGALRKRYQVLERRVKGAMKRDKKSSNDMVRKKVAPLMEAISKKGPLPVHSSNAKKKLPNVTSPHLQRYMNTSMPTMPMTSPITLQSPTGQSPYLHQSSPNMPQAPNFDLKVQTRFGATTPGNNMFPSSFNYGMTPTRNKTTPFSSTVENLESPSKHDTSSRLGIEKLINGDYSQMSAVKHFIGDGDDRTKDTPHSSTNAQFNSTGLMPNWNFDVSCSGLSMLSSSDTKASSKESNRRGTSILSSVLGRANDAINTPSPTKAPMLSQYVDISPVDIVHNQSRDSLSFSNFRMTEESQHALEREVAQGPLHTSPSMLQGAYTGTPNDFSRFPNAQASNLFHNTANNSLMVPQHEVDAAAATLSQMSNSSANFPTDLLSPDTSPVPDHSFADMSTPSKPRASLFQSVQDRAKK